VGYPGVTALSNGNYVVHSPGWNGGRGALTWLDGSAGVRGVVSAANSLVGAFPHDSVGNSVATFLTIVPVGNGNYVVASPSWNGGRGAATWHGASTPRPS
jgi:hypothetical protein